MEFLQREELGLGNSTDSRPLILLRQRMLDDMAMRSMGARTDSEFFHDLVRSDADVFLLQGRLPFTNLEGKTQSTPFSLMVVVFGADVRQKVAFAALVPGFWIVT